MMSNGFGVIASSATGLILTFEKSTAGTVTSLSLLFAGLCLVDYVAVKAQFDAPPETPLPDTMDKLMKKFNLKKFATATVITSALIASAPVIEAVVKDKLEVPISEPSIQ